VRLPRAVGLFLGVAIALLRARWMLMVSAYNALCSSLLSTPRDPHSDPPGLLHRLDDRCNRGRRLSLLRWTDPHTSCGKCRRALEYRRVLTSHGHAPPPLSPG